MIVLVAVETADVLFAFDSVPAALAVTDKTFLIYSANAFAILGLRSLFFLLSGLMARFHHLGTGLAVILAFIGVKMIISEWYHIPIGISLGVIAVVLAASIVWSMLTPPDEDDDPEKLGPPGRPRRPDGRRTEQRWLGCRGGRVPRPPLAEPADPGLRPRRARHPRGPRRSCASGGLGPADASNRRAPVVVRPRVGRQGVAGGPAAALRAVLGSRGAVRAVRIVFHRGRTFVLSSRFGAASGVGQRPPFS